MHPASWSAGAAAAKLEQEKPAHVQAVTLACSGGTSSPGFKFVSMQSCKLFRVENGLVRLALQLHG